MVRRTSEIVPKKEDSKTSTYIVTRVIDFSRPTPPATSQKFGAPLRLQVRHLGHLYTDKGTSHIIRNMIRKRKQKNVRSMP